MNLWKYLLVVASMVALIKLGLARRAGSMLRALVSRFGLLLLCMVSLAAFVPPMSALAVVNVVAPGTSGKYAYCTVARDSAQTTGSTDGTVKCNVPPTMGGLTLAGWTKMWVTASKVCANDLTPQAGCSNTTRPVDASDIAQAKVAGALGRIAGLDMATYPFNTHSFFGDGLTATTGVIRVKYTADGTMAGATPQIYSWSTDSAESSGSCVGCTRVANALVFNEGATTFTTNIAGPDVLYPDTYFTGGTAGGTSGATPLFCGAEIRFTGVTTSTGEERTIDPDEANYFATVGDVLHYDWESTPGVTGQVDIRFGNTAPWLGLLPVGNIGTSGSRSLPELTAAYFDEGSSGNLRLSAAVMRCVDTATGDTHYVNPGETVPAADASPRPCVRTTVRWPPEVTYNVGDLASFYFYANGPVAAAVLIEYATWDIMGEGAAPAVGSMTWATLADLVSGEYGDFNATAGYFGPSSQFVLRCTDNEGTMYTGQWDAGVRVNDVIYPVPGEAGCYSSTGLSLHPRTWVPASGRMVSCVGKALFIPDSRVIQASWDGLLEDAEQNAPLAWVYHAHEMVTDASAGMGAAVDANADDCIVMIPAGGELVDSDAGEVCPSAMGVTSLSAARPWLGVAVWIAWAWSMYGALFRKAPASTEPEQLTLF